MTLIHLVLNTGFVVCLMFLGEWLESINGINGLADKFFTPLPMGGFGLFVAFVESA